MTMTIPTKILELSDFSNFHQETQSKGTFGIQQFRENVSRTMFGSLQNLSGFAPIIFWVELSAQHETIHPMCHLSFQPSMPNLNVRCCKIWASIRETANCSRSILLLKAILKLFLLPPTQTPTQPSRTESNMPPNTLIDVPTCIFMEPTSILRPTWSCFEK